MSLVITSKDVSNKDDEIIALLNSQDDPEETNVPKKIFYSMDEVTRAYSPKSYKDLLIRQLSPGGVGKYMALQSIKKVTSIC